MLTGVIQMKELFKKLLESDLLTEETKTELETAIEAHLTEAVESAKAEAEVKVRAELTEQFIEDKNALIEAIDSKTEEFLTAELAELKEDIERFRDLEAEYAEKIVEARKEMAGTVKADMAELVETLDAFLEMRLDAEFEELKEDIDEVKKLEFGRKIFEAVAEEYKNSYVDDSEDKKALATAKTQLEEATAKLKETATELNSIKRDSKLNEVLEPLTGHPREVMEAILKNVPTEKLDEAFGKYIGRVLHEGSKKVEDVKVSEKESGYSPVLAEGATSTTDEGTEINEGETKVVTGDSLNEEVNDDKEEILSESKLNPITKKRLQSLAGLNQ